MILKKMDMDSMWKDTLGQMFIWPKILHKLNIIILVFS